MQTFSMRDLTVLYVTKLLIRMCVKGDYTAKPNHFLLHTAKTLRHAHQDPACGTHSRAQIGS